MVEERANKAVPMSSITFFSGAGIQERLMKQWTLELTEAEGGYVGKEASLPFANEMKNVLMNTVTEIFIAFTGLTLHEDPKIMTLLNEVS
ncbi:hypothetical protein GUITHDRAFT_102974 [Guillardia theta CCMP2712]|uniref:Uncharacterized protein n=1 Tax=Guillardia theta (strain CCMP2712) TaxID=905079 RepID=L1JS81_GUITC|nr:hypothetical protein GUITHDRAFT_102974 [Guillardia theta CCMP2712]EKX51050.1 hypothetical protein GUITHDRAFT_102974 [Guillardia theta CCMP2712]|eukprot:XP_005838030.1 hypothetical protein GUITHDRAFT_102974 [Guillardia theta CCMP2712]